MAEPFIPTTGLRFVLREKPVMGYPKILIESEVLQQRFENPRGGHEWRDVPVVKGDDRKHTDMVPISVQDTAQRLLSAYDGFMSGAALTPVQIADDRAVRSAAVYGAAAFMAAPDQDHGAHAMARAFLLALIDPLHPDLDYLRADPAAGQVARDARAAKIAEGQNG